MTTSTTVAAALAGQDYLADRALATAVYLAVTLEQPLLLEGEAGVGKTEVAKALAAARGARLIRLQCHEGIDVHHALYDWDFQRQLLALRGEAGEERAVLAALPAAPPAAGGDRGRRAGRAADRRDRPRRRRVRGVPARAAVGLPGLDPGARDDRRASAAGRWS